MGNSASEIISKVTSSTTEELQNLLNQDIELLQDAKFVYTSSKLSLRTDLAKYSVPHMQAKSEEKAFLPTDDEQALVISQSSSGSLKERREQVLQTLTKNISRNKELDIASEEFSKRLQAFCRVFEAVLRSSEVKTRKDSQIKEENSSSKLPPTARSAIKFGLNTLLCLVECVAVMSPEIYDFVVKDTTGILKEIGSLSMVTSDIALISAFADIAKFFEGVVAGSLPSIEHEKRLKSFGPLVQLALATGNTDLFVNTSARLLMTGPVSESFLHDLTPALQDLAKLKPKNLMFVWSEKKKGDSLKLNEERTRVMKNEDGIANVYSDFVFLTDRFYFEVKVLQTNDNCFLGVADSTFNSLSGHAGSGFSVSFKSSSEIYNKSETKEKFEAWKNGDSVGVFVDVNQKKIVFYKNGVKMTANEISFTSESLTAFMVLSGESKFEINTNPEYPADLSSMSHGIEKPKTQELIENSDLSSLTSAELGLFILQKMEEMISPFEYLLTSSFRFDKERPFLGVQFNKATVSSLYEMEKLLVEEFKAEHPKVPKEVTCQALKITLKLLNFHLRIAKDLDDWSLDFELKQRILELTCSILTEFSEDITALAGQIVSSSFEVFYKGPKEKMNYILNSLQRMKNHEETLPILSEMELNIYSEMARADKIFPAITLTSPEDEEIVKKLYSLLIDLSEEVSLNAFQSGNSNQSVVKLFESVQSALLAQSGKSLFKEKWEEILKDYISYYLSACERLVNYIQKNHSSDINENLLKSIDNSLVSRPLQYLLDSLVLSPLTLDLISPVISRVAGLFKTLNQLPCPPSQLVLGMGVIESIYESPHNYPDSANLTHTVKTPGALKYSLTFDPQCKTENGCDYLELWLDEAASKHFARWEGENFPKEPVEVNNSILHFTFRSDGSVNYWGWKITIKAIVQNSFFQKQWPGTLCDTIEHFFGICARKLVNGGFCGEVNEDVTKLLKNPLFKYGVTDRSSLIVKPLPPIDPNLMTIIDCFVKNEDSPDKDLLKFINKSPESASLVNYIKNFSSLEPHLPDSSFLTQLIEGNEKICESWTMLKKKSAVVGAASSIGGKDLDQAERAIFAVYTAFFEVVETMKDIFGNLNNAGPTVKMIVKQSCNIRVWAQKHKQQQMDAGNNDITYKGIAEDVVRKCWFLLGTGYKQSLQDIGIARTMKNLLSNIAQTEKKSLKIGSKWKAVQSAVKNVGRLKNLVSVKKLNSQPVNEDGKEFSRVAELVNGFLEQGLTLEKVVEALEINRARAVSRAAGLITISNLLSSSTGLNTFMVSSFMEEFSSQDSKKHYSEGLEGVDPSLMQVVQSSYFQVYSNLQRNLTRFHRKEFSYSTYIHFLSVIEALSIPLHSPDTHMLLDQPLLPALKVLLDWSKGQIKQKPLSRKFLKENCITRLGKVTQELLSNYKESLVLEALEGQPSQHLVFDKGGEELPIVEFKVLDNEADVGELEDALGQFSFNGANKWIAIRREEVKEGQKYLTGIANDLVPTFTSYSQLLAPPSQTEKDQLAKLKQKLSQKCWNLYKQLVFYVLGENEESNRNQTLCVQEGVLNVIFSELEKFECAQGLDLHQLVLQNLSVGESWIDKFRFSYFKMNPAELWFANLNDLNAPNEVVVVAQMYQEKVDPLLVGSGKLDAEMLEKFGDIAEDRSVSLPVFMRQVGSLPSKSESLDSFLSSNPDLFSLPDVSYSDPLNAETLISNLEKYLIPESENSFKDILSLFQGTSGLIPKSKLPETIPAEFKDPSENLDLYIALNAIRSVDRFESYKKELYDFFKHFEEIPQSLSGLTEIKKSRRDFTASLLWTLYGAFTQYQSSSALASEAKVKLLLKFAFSSDSLAIQTISMRLLSKILPAQHSPQSFEQIWKDFLDGSQFCASISDQLLKNIGKTVWSSEEHVLSYESQNLLTELLASERWRGEVVKKLQENLTETLEFLSKGLTIKAAHAGTLRLLSFSESFGVPPFVLAVVELKDCSFSVGVVTCEVSKTSFKVYSILDDTVITVEIDKIVNSVPLSKINLKLWFENENEKVLNFLVDVFDALARTRFFKAMESAATLKTLYLSLQTSVLESLRKFLEFSELSLEKADVLCKILSPLTKGSGEVSKQGYLKCAEFIEKSLKQLVEDNEELKIEEVKGKVESFSEEDKLKYHEIIEKGAGEIWTYKCFLKNMKTYEEVVNYIEEPVVTQVFKLFSLDESSLKITDVHGSAEIYQNSSSHLVIKDSTNSFKSFSFNFPSNLFSQSNRFVNQVTLRLVLQSKATHFGFKVGNLHLEAEENQIRVNNEGNLNFANFELVVLRILAEAGGKVTVFSESSNENVVVEGVDLFNGISIEDCSLYLEKGTFLSLVSLDVFDGVVSDKFSGKVDPPAKMEGGERSVKVKITAENIEKSKLRLLGISEEQAESCLKSTKTLPEAINYSFTHFDPELPETAFDFPDQSISEVSMFESLSSVPTDFTVVPFLENLSKVDFSLPNSKILAFKTTSTEKDKKIIQELFIVENSGGESIGNLSIGEAERANEFFTKSCQYSGKETSIRDLVFIKTSSLFNLKVPNSFELICDKEGRAINLAGKNEKDFYVFLAVSKSISLLGGTFYPLEKVPIHTSNYGLVEVSSLGSAKVDFDARYSSMKIMELYQELFLMEKSLRANSSKGLLSMVLNRYPALLERIVIETPIRTVLNLIPLKTWMDYLKDKEVSDEFFVQVLALMLDYVSECSAGRGLKPVFVESKHPYDNSQDIDDVIQIPGAKGLKIDFDSQCYTESGCDTLRFYSSSGRSGELKCFSGQGESSWVSFEVPGDTVYTYFHSDGSVNYWGYKFTVTPTNASKASDSEDSIDSNSLFEVLTKVLQKVDKNGKVSSSKVLAPFYLFLQISQKNDEKTKLLEVMKNLFEQGSSPLHSRVLQSFVKTAGKLFKLTKPERKSSNILQSLVLLLSKAHSCGKLSVDENWFLDLSDLLHDMHGLAFKNENLDLFLFETFKKKAKNVLEKDLESEHPYKLKTNLSKINVQGAHSLTLEFSKDSRAEERHTVHISKDEKGEQDAEQEEGQNTLLAAWDQKGPDVNVDASGVRVTRTSSSSWGNTFSNLRLEKGIFSVTVFVESVGDSAYLYIGFIESNENNNYDLSACLNNSHSQRVWTWKKSGEFNEKGSDNGNVPYENGDVLNFVVNTYNKTIVCFKNNLEVWTFRNIAESVLMGASFGGSNQFVVLRRVERVKGGKIEDKIVNVAGDTAYLRFPVYASAKNQYFFDSAADESVSADRLTASNKTEQTVIVPLTNLINSGRFYTQVRWVKGRCDFGVAPSASVLEKNINDSWILFSSSLWTEGDLIGCLVDTVQNSITFSINDKESQKLSEKLSVFPLKFVVILHENTSSMTLVPGKPSDLDLLTIDSEDSSTETGFKLKVIPHFKGRSFEAVTTFLSTSPEDFKAEWLAFRDKMVGAFKSSASEELVTYIDRLAASKSKDPLTLPVEEVDPTESELVFYPELEKMSKDSIKSLFSVLQDFNKRVEEVLYLFDLKISDQLTDMQKVLLSCRNFIFFSYKNSMLKKALETSKSEIRTEFTIDRPKAARHRNRKEVDTEAQFSITGQIFRAMSAVTNNGYRNSERIYKINYRGEASIDAGGPYNESMSNIVDELQSSFLHLLLPTANHAGNMGENREAWTINPSATSQTDFELFTFLGKLMGAAIRTQNNLGLSFAPLFWKKLVHEPVSAADLRGVDVCTVQIIEMLKNPAAHELTAENFSMAYDEKFVTKDSSGKDVELVPGGKDLSVTFENCGKYADLMLKARLGECDKAIARIREGISVVVQIDLLNLFSWRQVETLVCGTADVDVDILKENTDYEGCGLSDQHIQYFWEVLKEFSQIERSLFLKFVWGRKRLPSGKDWRHMKVTRYNPSGPVNNYMPISHTCFFTLDLPAYTSKEAMRQKLTYAITHCTAIDLDGSAGAGWEEND